MDTLVLTDGFMPINRVSWKKAITWVVSGRATVVEEYEDRVIRSPSQVFPMPSVVRFLHRVVGLFRRGVKFNRKNVWLRDKGVCFSAGTRVLMANGSQQDISRIQAGDRVIDAFGVPQTVVATGSRRSPVLVLRHRGSAIETQVTPDHPFLSPGGKWVPIQEFPTYLMFPRNVRYDKSVYLDFDAAEFLSRGRWMRVRDGRVYTSRRPHEVGVPTRLEMSAEHAYILGLFAAEGNCTGGQRVTFTFHLKEQDTLAADVVRFYTRLGFHPSLNTDPKNNRCVVRVCSKGLSEIFRHFCGSKQEKRTPWELLGSYYPDYLRGLFLGDGNFNHDLRRISLYLVADDLVFQAQSMLWGLGIYPTVQVVRRPHRKVAWGLVLNARNYSRFMKDVVGVEDTPDRKTIYGDENFVFRKVLSVNPAPTSVEVFNIEVADSHSYIANGLAVHNCQYCGTKVSQSEFTFDHVRPRNQGGTTKWENIVVCCVSCNQRKGNRTPEQANMRLRLAPVRPRSLPGTPFPDLAWREDMPQAWRDYLYWNTRLESG